MEWWCRAQSTHGYSSCASGRSSGTRLPTRGVGSLARSCSIHVLAWESPEGPRMLAAQKEESMWYTGLDFERFKNELLIEARNAGCMSGRECYDHIRRKFQDEATLNNTRMNVVQTQSNAVDPKPKRRRRGHKRSVSFDFDQARTVAARTTAYNASAPTADPVHTPPPSPPPSRHCRSRSGVSSPSPPSAAAFPTSASSTPASDAAAVASLMEQEQGGVQQEQEHALVCRAVRMGVGAMNGKTMSDELLTILQDSGDPKAEEIFM